MELRIGDPPPREGNGHGREITLTMLSFDHTFRRCGSKAPLKPLINPLEKIGTPIALCTGMSEAKSSAASRLRQWVRSLGVGGVATTVDLSVVLLLVEVMGMDPVYANVPALLGGAAVQFIGCRHLVFQATTGPLRRQLVEFGVVELGTLALNGIGFHLLVTLTLIPYAIARVGVSFLVFNGFSHPLWTLVFRQARAQSTEAD